VSADGHASAPPGPPPLRRRRAPTIGGLYLCVATLDVVRGTWVMDKHIHDILHVRSLRTCVCVCGGGGILFLPKNFFPFFPNNFFLP
jgi:hypothetical protein